MGYYTAYDLSAYNKNDEMTTNTWVNCLHAIEADVLKVLVEIAPGYFEGCSRIDDAFYDTIKWYDHNEDMIELSKRFPNYVFILEGQGEDPDDRWRAFYCNGESERIEARFYFPAPSAPFAEMVYNIYNDIE